MRDTACCDLNDFLKSVADDTRQRILFLLRNREMSVSELDTHLAVSQPTVSHHLAILRRSQLVTARYEGRWVYYRINPDCVKECSDEIRVHFKKPIHQQNMEHKQPEMIKRRMVVILAHPDDESFPLGGTLAKYAAEGVEITLVCATKGEAGIPDSSREETARLREHELLTAADVLGLSDVRFLGWLDSELDKADEKIVIGQLVAILSEIQPQVVITFGADGISGHPDHIAVHQLTTAAFKESGVRGLLYYIAPSEATQQGCGVLPPRAITGGPTIGIDVSQYLVTKVRATQCHASQNPPFSGDPKTEAEHLACHEYFVLAFPVLESVTTHDLFEQKLEMEVHHERA